MYEVCDPQYFTAEVCAQQNNYYAYNGAYTGAFTGAYAGAYTGLTFGFPYAVAAPAAVIPGACGCPLRAGEVNLQNIHWPLSDLGSWKTIVAVSIHKNRRPP